MTKIRPGQINPLTGNADKVLKVNAAGTAVVFGSLGSSTSDTEFIQDVVGALIAAGVGMTVTYNDAGNTETIAIDTAAEAERIMDYLAGVTTAGKGLVAGSGVTLTYDDVNDTITITSTGGGASALTVQDENTNISTAVSQIDFQGAGVTVTAGTGEVIVTIPGSSGGTALTVQDENANVSTAVSQIDFQGAGVTVTAGTGEVIVTIPGAAAAGHTIQEEGTPLTARTGLNFVGAGVTATDDSVNNRTIVTIAAPAAVGAFAGTFIGVLAVGTGVARIYNDTGVALTISSVRASVGTAPTGSGVTVDVNKNGVTIFTTQTNRPQIAASGITALAAAINVTSWAVGEYLTVDIDAVGSTVAGADLTVQIVAG